MKNGKKLLSILLAALLVALCVPVAFAGGGTDGNITWDYNEYTKTLTISGTGPMKNYHFIDYFQTSELDTPWFDVHEYVKDIVIQDGVTVIGDYAFCFLSAVTSVTIPDSVIIIGEGAFGACESLRSITIPDGVTYIGDKAFSGCYELESVTIPNGVRRIGAETFVGCYDLASVTIPASVTNIDDYAFCLDEALQTINYAGSEEDWSRITFGDDVFSIEKQIDGEWVMVPLDPMPTINYNYGASQPGTPDQPDQPGQPDQPAAEICKWCGQSHSNGFIQKIVGFFHRIFAAIFGAKY